MLYVQFLVFLILATPPRSAESATLEQSSSYCPEYSCLKERLLNVWDAPNWLLIVPVNTYHNRGNYTEQNIREFNEDPWGLGIGKWYRDKRNVRHELSFLIFLDSYKYPEPILGYAWQKDYFLDIMHNWSVGYGCNFFITARHKQSYIPFPGLTPHLAVQYKRLALNVAWVPRISQGTGDIFFTQLRWYF